MSDAIQRGSVVLRAGRYGVVWSVRGDVLVVLPIVPQGDARRAGDVPLAFADLLAGGIAMPSAQVCAGQPIEAAAENQVNVGELRGTVLCQIVLAVARVSAAAVTEDRWAAERRHRGEVQSIGPVRL